MRTEQYLIEESEQAKPDHRGYIDTAGKRRDELSGWDEKWFSRSVSDDIGKLTDRKFRVPGHNYSDNEEEGEY